MQCALVRSRAWAGQAPAQGPSLPGRLGKRAADSRSKQCAKWARDPWVLVSNLPPHWDARGIVTLYARRMRIEEGFRDLECIRYGMGLQLAIGATSPC